MTGVGTYLLTYIDLYAHVCTASSPTRTSNGNKKQNGPLPVLIHLFFLKPPYRLSHPCIIMTFFLMVTSQFLESILPVLSPFCLSVQMTGSPFSPCHHTVAATLAAS